MSNNKNNFTEDYSNINRLIHEPTRYNIMALLYVVEHAEYLFVLNQTELTSGNLTAHLSKLEEAGYVSVQKKFVKKKPKTFLRLTSRGRNAFDDYREEIKRVINTLPEIKGE